MLLFRGLLAALALVAALFSPALAQAKWLRAESARFIIYTDGDEALLRQYATKVEDFDTILRGSHGLDPNEIPPRKFEVYLVRDIQGLRKVVPDTDERTGGFYLTGLGDVFTVLIRGRGDDNDDILFHEYTHHFMRQYMTPRYPGWVMEGYAEYFASAKLTPTRFELGKPGAGRAYSLTEEAWIGWDKVLNARPLEMTRDDRAAYYAQAWLLTHYMKGDPARFRQLKTYETLLASGKDTATAWQEATGLDMAALQAKLKAYSKGNVASIAYTRATPQKTAAVTITAMPASADDLLLDRQRLRYNVMADDEEAFLAQLRLKAAKHPGDRLATLTLAHAETEFGDVAKGQAMLDTLLAANPDDAEALRLKAVSLMKQAYEANESPEAAFKAAGKLLARANKAEPDDYRTLFHYARSRQLEDGYPSDNTLNVLLLTSQLAPQVAQARLEAARGLMLRKMDAEAIEQLNPVANDPHGGGAAEAARSLLRQLAAGR